MGIHRPILLGLALLAGCDGLTTEPPEQPEAPADQGSVATPAEPAVAAAPAAPTAPTATAEAAAGAAEPTAVGDEEGPGPEEHDGAFADGRFAIELPWTPQFTEQDGELRAEHEGPGVTSLTYRSAGPFADVAGTAELYSAAERAAGEGARLSPGRLDHWIVQRHHRARAGVHHAVVAWLADETVFVLEGRGGRDVVDEVERVAHTFRVLRPSGGVDQSRTEVGEEDIGVSPVATAREAARAPRSNRRGAESFGASCNSIGANDICDEVEPGLAEHMACGALGVLSERLPCPNEGRIGTCLIQDGRRARHFYEGYPEAEQLCERLGGEFHEDHAFPRRP